MALKGLLLNNDKSASRRRDRALIETEALRLYDKLNAQPDKIVRVSKAECLRRARLALLSRNLINS